jgi:hypothetical protein
MGPIGFGNAPGRGPRGLRADQPPPNTGDDLHAIRQRYCGGNTLVPQSLALTTNQAIKFDLTGTPINAIVLTCTAGQINGYFSDVTSNNGKAATTPHFVASAAIAPITEVIPVTPGTNYVIGFQEGTGAAGGATGYVTFMYQ